MDSEAAVNWAAGQPWSNGNVGMWGKSYDAWTQVMALAENPIGLKAVVIQAPLIEGYRAAWMNGVHYNAGWYLTPSLYTAYDVLPVTHRDALLDEHVNGAAGAATGIPCHAEQTVMTALHERTLPYWRERDIVDLAGRSSVPTLWTHGSNDVNTKPDNFLDVYSRLRGPKRVWFGQWAHDRGNEVQHVGRAGFIDEAMDWFDHYLKSLPLVEHANAAIQDGEGRWRSERSWPPEDAIGFDVPIRPASYVDGNSATGFWSITSPAPHDMRIAGTPRLEVDVETQIPLANLIVQVYEVSTLVSTMISRGAYRLGDSGRVAFDLYPNDWVLRAGKRIGIRITSSDSLFQPIPTGSTVRITGGRLTLPFLTYERVLDLDGSASSRRPPTTTVNFLTINQSGVAFDFPPPMTQCGAMPSCPQS